MTTEAANDIWLDSRVSTRPLKFAVLQMGARMHYAIPALLMRAGLLSHFYTDAVGNLGVMGALGGVLPSSWLPAPAKRFLGRRIPDEVPASRVTTAEGLAILDGILGQLTTNRTWSSSASEWLRWRIMSDNYRGASALYCLDPGDLEVMRRAKRRGLTVVYEQIIAPQVGRILREERSRFPGFENQDAESVVEEGIRLDREVWSLADVVLAPSEFVRSGMIELGARPDNIALVPYGLPERWYMPTTARPVTGRVLFVGGVGLRKGNHYLAEACRILKARGVNADFRVVGPYDAGEIASPLFQGPEYVGQIPRSDVRGEFLQADVFAFPTLAEGFALAHLEAMACGVPVVTTPNCGPAVRDGRDGFIVPPRDAVALADRVQMIIADRALRTRLGASAQTRAAEYSWMNYRSRLLGALGNIPGSSTRHEHGRRQAA